MGGEREVVMEVSGIAGGSVEEVVAAGSEEEGRVGSGGRAGAAVMLVEMLERERPVNMNMNLKLVKRKWEKREM